MFSSLTCYILNITLIRFQQLWFEFSPILTNLATKIYYFPAKDTLLFCFFFALHPFRFRLINSVKGLFCLLQLLLKKKKRKKKGKTNGLAQKLAGEFLIWRHPFARTQGCGMRVCMQNRSTWPGMPSGTSHSEFGNTQMHLWSVGKEMNDNHRSVFDHFLHEPCSSTWRKLQQHAALSCTDASD